VPGAKSFQYEDVSSIARIRGGGADSDEIDLQISSQLSSLQIGASTPAGLWKKIRLLRGGVDAEKSEDGIDEVEDKESKPSNNFKGHPNETYDDIETPASTAVNDKSSSSNLLSEGANEDKSKQTNRGREGGVFSSFVSLFRAPVVEDPIKRSTNTTDIAHKMSHGSDGRGGGSSVAVALPPSSTECSKEEGKHEITTEVAKVSTDATAAETLAPAKSTSTVSEAKIMPAVRTGVDSTAFVVPPNHNRSPSIGDGKGKDVKKSKASKSKLVVEEVDETKALNASLNITRNETDAITASNDTMNNNTIPTTLNVSSAAEDTADDIEMRQPMDYTSSGYWVGIDLVASLGLSSLTDDLKISRALRTVRKAASKATGLHGFISGKEYTINHQLLDNENFIGGKTSTVISIDEELGIHDSNALEAEMLAQRVASRKSRRGRDARVRGNKRQGKRWGFRRGQQATNPRLIVSDYVVVPALDTSPDALELRRRKRVEDIDRLLQRGNERLLELQCERDDLLCAPNPLFNYTKKYDPSTNHTFGDVRTSREFNFPSDELVDEYIGELVSHRRLIRLNHTELWQSRSDFGMEDDEDEIVGDDLLTPGADARKLYENLDELEQGVNRNKGGGGSWLLRTGFGNGGSLGEKLGEAIEIAAYKGVCSSVMMVFAQMLSALHGVNVMSHSDIRTYIEQDPDLPPVDKKHGPLLSRDNNNYAQEAIKTAIQKGAKKKRKTSKHSSSHRSSSRSHGHELSDDAFIQRDFVVETLISHCQISAPLLKLFPLDWQRAMVGNIVTLATAIVSDFADGLQVQMLGHALTVSFKPITEADLVQHIGVGGFRQNHRRSSPDEFEAAVLATAQDISESLSFLDGWLEWFERKVGGGVLRSQIGNLIARVVLTLVDEVLSGARLDLWSSQANGPRLYAALEYRDTTISAEQLN